MPWLVFFTNNSTPLLVENTNSGINEGHNVWIGRQYFREVLLSDLEKE